MVNIRCKLLGAAVGLLLILVGMVIAVCVRIGPEKSEPITLQSRTESSWYYQKAIREGRDTEVINKLKRQLYRGDGVDRQIAVANLASTLDPRAYRILMEYFPQVERRAFAQALAGPVTDDKRKEAVEMAHHDMFQLISWLCQLNRSDGNQAIEMYLYRFEKEYGGGAFAKKYVQQMRTNIANWIEQRDFLLDWIFRSPRDPENDIPYELLDQRMNERDRRIKEKEETGH